MESDPSQAGFVRAALLVHERALVAYAARLTGDLERARDVVQETFLELCERPRAEVEPRLAAWLYTVCRNRALDARRKESRMRLLADSSAHASPAQDGQRTARAVDPTARLEGGDTSSRVLRELAALPEREREVLRLKFQGGFAYREIAEVTGLSVANVGFLIHCGLKRLRSRLQPLANLEVQS